MPIVNSVIEKTINKSGGARRIHERHTDQNGRVFERRYIAPPAGQFDEVIELAAYAAQLTLDLPRIEAKEDVARALQGGEGEAPNHTTQADNDRRVLAQLMQIEEAAQFGATLPWFRAFETRAGANANSRAIYLGVPKSEYDLVADRYNLISGIISGLDGDAARVWQEPLPGWD